MRAAETLLPGGLVAERLAEYELRPSQLELAEAVQTALESEQVLLAEAPTGTGKTLAFLVPALLYAEQTGRRVIVSTATRTLQDQMFDQDASRLGEIFEVGVASMKGLSNYLCLRRFEAFKESAAAAASKTMLEDLGLVQAWRKGADTGERRELTTLSDEAPVWREVTSSSETRIGSRCSHFDDCFVTKMRRQADAAGVVIVNHHLFFADLAARRASHRAQVLPDYDAVIFDEAHQIEGTAALFFGVTLSASRIEALVRDAERAFRRTKLTHYEPLTRTLLQRAAAFFLAVPAPRGEGSRENLSQSVHERQLKGPLEALDEAAAGLSAFAKRHSAGDEGLGQIHRRAEGLRRDFDVVAGGSNEEQVCYSEVRGRSVSVGATPIDVSEILQEELFLRTGPVILTSATLSTDNNFEFVRSRLGVSGEAEELTLSSPFDYPNQAALYCPSYLPAPREVDFLSAATKELEELIALTDGGAFVLCTSIKMQRALHEATRISQPKLMQGAAPKATLLQRFRSLGNAVLFATSSFWEGVDVPGSALRLVVIDKLPFEVPSDPLVAARSERLRKEGVDPFSRYQVPAAALALKQGFGRLIRTKTDRGIVAVLDARLVTRSYGRRFLRTLPPAERCGTFDDLERFWSEASP